MDSYCIGRTFSLYGARFSSHVEELSIQRRGDYLIGSNGAQLIQASTGKLLEELKLPAEFCRRVTTQIEQQGFSWQIYIEGTIYCNRMNEWAILDHQLSGLPIEIISDMDAFLRGGRSGGYPRANCFWLIR
ncbi:MAG: HAD hydrolase family protein [Rectinema sp.]